MILNKIISQWLFSKMDVWSHMLRHLLYFTNFPIAFCKSGYKVAFFFFLTKPSIKSSFNAVVVNLLGLEDRNPVGGWLSYLFTLMVIIQPSLTHFCLFIFPSHAYLVKFLKRQTCHWSDQTEHLAFFSHTHAFKVLFHFSPAFSV